MNTKQNTTNTVSFAEAFAELPAAKQRLVRNEMIAQCGWSRLTFYNKIKCVHRITLPEQRIITELFHNVGYDAWTGEKINNN